MVRERLRNVCHFDSCCVASKVRSEPKVLGAALVSNARATTPSLPPGETVQCRT